MPAAQVEGVYCKNGHFNDPDARYCAVCGISMGQLTKIRQKGTRPPLGVLILGDVLNNMNLMTGIAGLHEPPDFFNVDSAQNRASARRLAALRPSLACFGHGPPLRDTRKFVDFVQKLA